MQSGVQTNRYAILEAPSVLGLRPTGVDRLPEALLSHGIAERLSARRAGRIEPNDRYDAVRDPETLTLNARAIADYTRELADAVGHLLDAGEFPILLGGDCSIVLGPTLALRRRGRFGLLFIDGHTDFFQPEANPNGEAASMDLAFATGRGPPLITNLDGLAPFVRDTDAVAFGFRDFDERAEFGGQPLPPELRALDLAAVREMGVVAAAREAVSHLTRSDLGGFWIHVDADSLDDAVMPAVDYRIPDGLSPRELGTALRTALASGRAVGFEITIYNPSLDPQGSAGRVLADLLVDAFR